jgi:hypothetical protein
MQVAEKLDWKGLSRLLSSLHNNPHRLVTMFVVHNSPPLDCIVGQRRRYVCVFTFIFHPISISWRDRPYLSPAVCQTDDRLRFIF